MSPRLLAALCGSLAATLLATHAWADGVRVDNAWVRATAPGQKVAGAFMALTADRDLTLVAAESPASKTVELHTMRMDGDVMVMRQVKEIPLPKDKTVELKPGGLHVMLIDIKSPLQAGGKVALTLVVKDTSGKSTHIPVEAMIRAPGGQHGMH